MTWKRRRDPRFPRHPKWKFLIPAPLCALLLMMLSRLSIVRFLPLLNRSPLRFCCLHSDAIPGAEYDDDAGGWKYPSDAQVPDVSFAVGDNLYQVCNKDITEFWEHILKHYIDQLSGLRIWRCRGWVYLWWYPESGRPWLWYIWRCLLEECLRCLWVSYPFIGQMFSRV